MKVLRKQTNSHDCLVCGIDNPDGVHASFYEMEDQSVVALFSFKPLHQSYPERTHGGMISAIIDETIGRTVWTKKPGSWACTIKLSVDFHKAVPYGVPLECIGRLTKIDNISFQGTAEIKTIDGKLLAKGNGLYMFLPLSTISPNKSREMHPDDINVYVPDGIKDIDI
jgi:uncharacterized protein (TIGR00369 family)